MNAKVEAGQKLPPGEPGQSIRDCPRTLQPSAGIVLGFLKYAWAFPVTFLGLIAVGLTAISGGSVRVVAGVVEAWGGFATWLIRDGLRNRVSAMTVGHVIIGMDGERIGDAREHEHVHIRQYERWGILFIPLYAASSILAWSRGGHYYRDNVFEREAYAISDGKPRA